VRNVLTSLAEVAGMGLIVAGVAMWSVQAAFVAAGVCLLLVGLGAA
jgi:hypothetical protein